MQGLWVPFCLFGPLALMMSFHVCVSVYKKDKHDPGLDIAPMYIPFGLRESCVRDPLEVELESVTFFMATRVVQSIPGREWL